MCSYLFTVQEGRRRRQQDSIKVSWELNFACIFKLQFLIGQNPVKLHLTALAVFELSRQSGRFWYQRYALRIQSSAKIKKLFTVNCWKDKDKEKRGQEWPIKNQFNGNLTVNGLLAWIIHEWTEDLDKASYERIWYLKKYLFSVQTVKIVIND